MTKKSMWIIHCETISKLKVCFDEDVTAEEALKRFENDDYEDIMDEDALSTVGLEAE